MKTEWLCRDCEVSVEKLVIHAELVSPRVSETGQVIEGRPQVLIMKNMACERCGVLKQCFEYEKTEAPLVEEETPTIEATTEEEAGTEDTVSELEIKIDVSPVYEEDDAPVSAEALVAIEKEAEIARLKAMLKELEEAKE